MAFVYCVPDIFNMLLSLVQAELTSCIREKTAGKDGSFELPEP